MAFKLIWETRTKEGKRVYSEKWSRDAKAYIRGHYAGQPYFESLRTGSRRVAAIAFAQRQSEIVSAVDDRRMNTGRVNFAWAVKNYFGPNKPEEKDPADRITPIFNLFATRFLDEITQQDLDDAAAKLRPNAGPKTRNREVYTPFIAVYTAAVEASRAPRRVWRRPEGAHAALETNAPSDTKIKALIDAASDRTGRSAKTAARNKAALLMLTLTGERTTAATVKLKWRDIDFDAGIVLFSHTKNGLPRSVLMAKLLIAALRDWAAYCPAKGSTEPDPDALVFGWKTRTGMAQMVQHARARAKVGKLRPHDIGRHSFGRRLRQKGKLDRPKLKKAGNWLSDKAVERYDHFEIDEVSEAVRDIDTSELE